MKLNFQTILVEYTSAYSWNDTVPLLYLFWINHTALTKLMLVECQFLKNYIFNWIAFVMRLIAQLHL